MPKPLLFDYLVGERVKIKVIEVPGLVIGIYVGRRGIEYQIRYCYNGKYEEIYLMTEEIEVINA